ncbi:laminin subunit alpha-2-like [Crassostrea virginica]
MCPQNCQDGYCDIVEGTCLACKQRFIGPRCMECAAGLFGNNCYENCSLTCGNPGVCHKVTGHCNGSCLAGWEGNMCENECLVGLYGMNCLENCSMTCGIPGNCDRITGYCNGGCQRGWTGVRCEEGNHLINNKP